MNLRIENVELLEENGVFALEITISIINDSFVLERFTHTYPLPKTVHNETPASLPVLMLLTRVSEKVESVNTKEDLHQIKKDLEKAIDIL